METYKEKAEYWENIQLNKFLAQMEDEPEEQDYQDDDFSLPLSPEEHP